MRRFLRFLAVLGGAALIIAYGLAHGDAGTVTITEQTHRSIKEVLFDCTAATVDSIDATTTAAFDGELIAVSLLPSTTSPPSDSYSFYLYDSDGMLLFSNSACDSATNYVFSYGGGGAVHIGALSNSTLRLVADGIDSSSCAACAEAKFKVWIR